MKNLFNNHIWSIEPHSFNKIMECLNKIDITALTTQELERDGGEVKVLNNVAVIPILGTMLKDAGKFLKFFGFVSSKDVQEAVETASKDTKIDTIVLSINSPGGQTGGLVNLANAISKARESKKVIAVVDGMCCSAAYWVASQAEKIYTSSIHDMVGSIGVKMVVADTSKLYENAGIKVHAIDTGKFKSAGEEGTEITEEHLAEFQKMIDTIYEDFILAVAGGRNSPIENVMAVADGRVFLTKEAANKGLIDGMKDLSSVVGEQIVRESVDFRSRARAKLALRGINLTKGDSIDG